MPSKHSHNGVSGLICCFIRFIQYVQLCSIKETVLLVKCLWLVVECLIHWLDDNPLKNSFDLQNSAVDLYS